jgi:prepilin-type processing-associated H-X9-DG protein
MIELLSVVAIITILIALLLPAIMKVRDAARRVHCQNNLLQLGVALGNDASTHRVFPPGVIEAKGPIINVPRGYHVGWALQILPYIEQGNIYRRYDFRRGVYDGANTTALEVRPGLFVCPLSGGFTDYVGCHHDVEAPIDVDNHGVLFLNSHVGYDDITDGPACTILLGEVRGGATLSWASGTRGTLRNTGTRINMPEPTFPAASKPFASAGQASDELEGVSGDESFIPLYFVGGFSSKHGFGANFLFCDGSVHFLNEGIDQRVFRHLGHRADGEIIDDEQY